MAEYITQLTRRKRRSVYFSISENVHGRGNGSRWITLIQKIPDDRILAESDMEDPSLSVDALNRAYEMIASAKKWSFDETKIKIGQNFRNYLL